MHKFALLSAKKQTTNNSVITIYKNNKHKIYYFARLNF